MLYWFLGKVSLPFPQINIKAPQTKHKKKTGNFACLAQLLNSSSMMS